ncbi:MAG: MBL fold metallo-hydrolase [bacterium]|jgi:glyoxylase-like metal-dependent hydrolase (beta-lactamase superfamily II)|nr:MBL fold metallo-hydrolase [bacterium]
MLQILTIPVSPLEANCYVLYSPETKEGLIVDPGDEGAKIIAAIQKHGLQPLGIVNTHGHVDHIGANREVKKAFEIPIAIHAADAPMLVDAEANLSAMIAEETLSPPADRLLEEGDTFQVGDTEIVVMHTPGHSPGGICLFFENTLIAGDTLFQGSVGRTDLPGGDFVTLMASIQNRLETLADEVVVYPGHGLKTTMGEEKRTNPFLRRPTGECCK